MGVGKALRRSHWRFGVRRMLFSLEDRFLDMIVRFAEVHAILKIESYSSLAHRASGHVLDVITFDVNRVE